MLCAWLSRSWLTLWLCAPRFSCPQAYSGDALQQKITAKAASMPDLITQIQEQQGSVGKPPTPTPTDSPSTALGYVHNTAAIVAGTVVPFVVITLIVAAGLLLLARRRRAAALLANQQGLEPRYAVADINDGATRGPVAEATEGSAYAAAFYTQRARGPHPALAGSSPAVLE